MKCPYCGAENGKGEKCVKCKAALPTSKPKKSKEKGNND